MWSWLTHILSIHSCHIDLIHSTCIYNLREDHGTNHSIEELYLSLGWIRWGSAYPVLIKVIFLRFLESVVLWTYVMIKKDLIFYMSSDALHFSKGYLWRLEKWIYFVSSLPIVSPFIYYKLQKDIISIYNKCMWRSWCVLTVTIT